MKTDREARRQQLHALVAVYAEQAAGSLEDLDPELEYAGIELLLTTAEVSEIPDQAR